MRIKRLTFKPLKPIGLALGLSLATVGILTPPAQAYENLIPDKNLAKCINHTISHNSEADADAIITKTDLAKLTELRCWDSGITLSSQLNQTTHPIFKQQSD